MEPEAISLNPETPVRNVATWKIFLYLLAVSVLGSLLVVPYSWSLSEQMPLPETPLPREVFLIIVHVVQVGLETLLAAGAIALGLWLGGKVGLGVPRLRAWLAGEPGAGRRLWGQLPLAVVLGLVAGGIITALSFAAAKLQVMQGPPKVILPPAWEGFLASVGAGIREEVWLRLGAMSFLAWLGTKVCRQDQPSAGVIWMANLFAALLFGALHLPQAAALIGMNAFSVLYVLLLNGVGGLVFGWLYWRRGLLAAMAAHFSAGLVLKVILPLLHS